MPVLALADTAVAAADLVKVYGSGPTAVIALVVAAIVIYNTFTILVAQREKEVALLRCVGASRRQVFTGMLTESLVAGAVASAAGIVAGLGLGWGLEHLFSAFGASIPSGAPDAESADA